MCLFKHSYTHPPRQGRDYLLVFLKIKNFDFKDSMSKMSPRVRFAPSPTGLLHVGNARTALVNCLYAKKNNGIFILRLDDTDAERGSETYAEGIHQDLKWLGIIHQEYYRQSDHLERYQNVINKLEQVGRLYPCYETPEELDFKRKRLLAQGRPPIYDRSSRNLSSEQMEKYMQENRKPHWRFFLNPGKITWDDLAHGPMEFDAEKLSDPILIREDGSPVYTLSSVVDDLDMKITHVIRGNDHISNTAIQIQLYEAIGGTPADLHFGHLPLIAGEQGESLSKRLGSISLQSLREEGIDPMAINSYLASLGTSNEIKTSYYLEALTIDFDLKKFGQASPKFSLDVLWRLNEKLLHNMPFEMARPKLHALNLSHITESFWNAMRGNLKKIKDIGHYWSVCNESITPVIEDRPFILTAKSLLPDTPWDEFTWQKWTDALKEQTGRQGKELFRPLRLALTGEEHGPEMKKLLLAIGPEKVLERLSA